MNNRDIVDSFDIISSILAIHNKEIEEIKKRVDKLEVAKNDDDYIIRIPKNASNLDVLRKVFNCKIVSACRLDNRFMLTDLDTETSFHTDWLKTKYKGGVEDEAIK